MKTFLILDAHDVVRQGLKWFIERDLGESVFGEASGAPDALELARGQIWDAAIIEERSGLEVLEKLKQIQPQLPVLVLALHSEVEFARRAFQLGAAGYVTKSSSREELSNAVNTVIEGRRYVSPDIAASLAEDLERAAGQLPFQSLSHRELEVMSFIAFGKTMGEIAVLLGLSDKTVSTYRSRVLEKMGMRTNAEIIRYSIHNEIAGLASMGLRRPARPRTAKLKLAACSSEPEAQTCPAIQPNPKMADAQAARADLLSLRIVSGLTPYVGSAGVNQILESVADDQHELEKKIESLLRAFLGETAGTRLASRIIDARRAGG